MNAGDGSDLAGSSRDLGASLAEMQELAGGFAREIGEAARAMRAMDGETQRLSRSLGSSLRSAFDRAVFGGGKFSDVMRGLVRDVALRSFDAALRPVQGAIGSGLAGGLAGSLAGAFGFANGGAFSGGRVRAFARGGVVDGPTMFPMRGGAGLMGEAGPEAVMPLTRGPDGRLGVAARGGGGPVVTVNITTPDIEGFRRSRGQVAAELARAVSRGASRL